MNSKWTSEANTYLGYSNSGQIYPDAQNTIGANGTITIKDNGEFDAYGSVYVGLDGNGTIHIKDGGKMTVNDANVTVGFSGVGNGEINIVNGGVLTLDDSEMTIGQQNPGLAGRGSLNMGAGGRVIQTYTQDGNKTIVFHETSTFTVELSSDMANSEEAFVTAVNVYFHSGVTLEVKTGGIVFDKGDKFILFSADLSLTLESGAISVPSVVTPSDSNQTFSLEHRSGDNGYFNLVLVANAYPIPEPSTYALFGGLAAVGLAVLCRRRQRKA